MMSRDIDISSGFPGLPDWDLQPPATQFDYARWHPNATLHLCNCPWGTSEVQVGARSIIGQGNVVDFGSETKRDAWFDDNAQGLTFEIMYRAYDQSEYTIPVPFDVAMRYNYIWIEYTTATTADNPIDYETSDGVRRVFYFVRDLESDNTAPNTTRVEVLPDYWTTYRYQITFTGMMLKRGHYAVDQAPSVDTYLGAPANHCDWISEPDVQPSQPLVNYGESIRDTFSSADNGKVWAVTAWSCSVTTSVDSSGGEIHTAKPATWIKRGGGGYNLCALDMSNLEQLFEKLEAGDAYAQLGAAFRGIYYIADDYIKLGANAFAMFGWEKVSAYQVMEVQGVVETDKYYLSRAMYNYPEQCAGYTKLYTAPYAMLSINTTQGNHWEVSPQALKHLRVATNCVFTVPSIAMSHHLLGIETVLDQTKDYYRLRTVDADTNAYYCDPSSNDYAWVSPIKPHFALLGAADYYKGINYNNRVVQSSNVQKQYELSIASADVMVTNQDLANSASSLATSKSNTASNKIRNANNTKLVKDNAADLSYQASSTNIENEYLATSTAVNNTANMGIAVTNGVSNVASGVIGGAATGGVVGALLGGVTSGISTAASIQSASISAGAASSVSALAIGKAAALSELAQNNSNAKTTAAQSCNISTTNASNSARTDITSNNNDAAAQQASNSASQNKAIALQQKGYMTSLLASQPKDYKLQQGGMQTLGSGSDDSVALTSVDDIHICVKRIPDGDALRIADQFARYGYTCNNWVYNNDGIDLTRGSAVYSYWECESIQANYYMPDAFADRIKMLLLGGITVYSDPDDIGKGVINYA